MCLRFSDKLGARPCRQRGAAIIVAMLTLLLVTLVAAQAVNALHVVIDTTTGYRDQAQARALARSAVDWARNILADDAQRTHIDHLMEPWALRVPPTPLSDHSEISGEILDQSGLFNLNNLVFEGRPNPLVGTQFIRLLVLAGVPDEQARVLTGGLQASMAAPRGSPPSDPGRPLMSVDELQTVPGFTPELWQTLRPWVTALPSPSRVNVNTAPAAVLHAIVEGLSFDGAQQMTASRSNNWFGSVSDFMARLPEGTDVRLPQQLDVSSRYFIVNGRARHGVAAVHMAVLLDRRSHWADVLWIRILS